MLGSAASGCGPSWLGLLKAAEEVVEMELGRLSRYLCPVPTSQVKGAGLPKDVSCQALRGQTQFFLPPGTPAPACSPAIGLVPATVDQTGITTTRTTT